MYNITYACNKIKYAFFIGKPIAEYKLQSIYPFFFTFAKRCVK